MSASTAHLDRQSGYSLIELFISSLLLGMMIFAVSTLSLSGSQAQEYSRRLTRVTEITQEVLDDLRLELVSSVRLFSDDAEGYSNLALLDLDGAPTPLTFSYSADRQRLVVRKPAVMVAADWTIELK